MEGMIPVIRLLLFLLSLLDLVLTGSLRIMSYFRLSSVFITKPTENITKESGNVTLSKIIANEKALIYLLASMTIFLMSVAVSLCIVFATKDKAETSIKAKKNLLITGLILMCTKGLFETFFCLFQQCEIGNGDWDNFSSLGSWGWVPMITLRTFSTTLLILYLKYLKRQEQFIRGAAVLLSKRTLI